jgi:hypothetical protein
MFPDIRVGQLFVLSCQRSAHSKICLIFKRGSFLRLRFLILVFLGICLLSQLCDPFRGQQALPVRRRLLPGFPGLRVRQDLRGGNTLSLHAGGGPSQLRKQRAGSNTHDVLPRHNISTLVHISLAGLELQIADELEGLSGPGGRWRRVKDQMV